jgi:hypothetical protein
MNDEVRIIATRKSTGETWFAYGEDATMARAHAEHEVHELNVRYPEIEYAIEEVSN